MSIQSVLRFEYECSAPIDVEAVDEQVTSDAGLLPIRQFDERLGWSAGFAAQLRDKRCGGFHTFVEMVRQRVFGIIAGYEDQNDHDTLRSDGVFKLVVGRLPDDDDLASQPTLSRMENSVTAGELLRLQDWFLERFIESFDEPPRSLTLDIDTFDDPTHGQQQLTLFHGFYKQYQYLARAITCAENDLMLFPVLMHGTARDARRDGRHPTRHGTAASGMARREDSPASRFGLRGSGILRDLRRVENRLHDRAGDESRAEGDQRTHHGCGFSGLGANQATATTFCGLRVSSRKLDATAVGRRQMRSPCARDQSPGRGDESAGRSHHTARRLR